LKGRVLGYNHPDYAETMYHLGTVLHMLGKNTDAEALILDSLKILEACRYPKNTDICAILTFYFVNWMHLYCIFRLLM
jgi:hypothetical protein